MMLSVTGIVDFVAIYIKHVIRATEVSHAACKDEFRTNPDLTADVFKFYKLYVCLQSGHLACDFFPFRSMDAGTRSLLSWLACA